MKSALTHWSEIAARVERAPGIFLGLDFDGVLAPIVRLPAHARMLPSTRKVLQRLSKTPGISLAVISGRGLADLQHRVGLKKIPLAGNHGLEMKIGGSRTRYPLSADMRRDLKTAKVGLELIAQQHPPCHVEDKGMGLSLHYRELPHRSWPALKKDFHRLEAALPSTMRLTLEKRVYEIRPRVPWNKGHVTLRLWKQQARRALPFYIGDDATDEDAFAALKGKGITIRVGKHRSRARYFLNTPAEAARFLDQLQQLMKRRRSGIPGR